jgi:hypothetical protein
VGDRWAEEGSTKSLSVRDYRRYTDNRTMSPALNDQLVRSAASYMPTPMAVASARWGQLDRRLAVPSI